MACPASPSIARAVTSGDTAGAACAMSAPVAPSTSWRRCANRSRQSAVNTAICPVRASTAIRHATGRPGQDRAPTGIAVRASRKMTSWPRTTGRQTMIFPVGASTATIFALGTDMVCTSRPLRSSSTWRPSRCPGTAGASMTRWPRASSIVRPSLYGASGAVQTTAPLRAVRATRRSGLFGRLGWSRTKTRPERASSAISTGINASVTTGIVRSTRPVRVSRTLTVPLPLLPTKARARPASTAIVAGHTPTLVVHKRAPLFVSSPLTLPRVTRVPSPWLTIRVWPLRGSTTTRHGSTPTVVTRTSALRRTSITLAVPAAPTTLGLLTMMARPRWPSTASAMGFAATSMRIVDGLCVGADSRMTTVPPIASTTSTPSRRPLPLLTDPSPRFLLVADWWLTSRHRPATLCTFPGTTRKPSCELACSLCSTAISNYNC